MDWKDMASFLQENIETLLSVRPVLRGGSKPRPWGGRSPSRFSDRVNGESCFCGREDGKPGWIAAPEDWAELH